MAAVTMVKGDHAFLARWVEYYGGLIGRENLFILRQGHDPEIDRIAAGANILHQPETVEDATLDIRRWATLSHFTSGLTLYYNWVLCTEVDEIVAPDPATGLALPDYLDAMFATGRAPQVVAPFGIDLVPPADAASTGPVLCVGQTFRLNGRKAKHCITRRRISFGPGGRGSSVRDVHMDQKLFLFHLRPQYGAKGSTLPDPVTETIEFADLVAALTHGPDRGEGGHGVTPDLHSTELYRLPERFAALF